MTLFVPRRILLSSKSRHNRDLHTFPTRRSSDLTRGGSPRRRRNPRRPARRGRGRGRRRSEEHTSELQSRRDLVCRLLLEKKKNYKEFGPKWNRSLRHLAL